MCEVWANSSNNKKEYPMEIMHIVCILKHGNCKLLLLVSVDNYDVNMF